MKNKTICEEFCILITLSHNKKEYTYQIYTTTVINTKSQFFFISTTGILLSNENHIVLGGNSRKENICECLCRARLVKIKEN